LDPKEGQQSLISKSNLDNQKTAIEEIRPREFSENREQWSGSAQGTAGSDKKLLQG